MCGIIGMISTREVGPSLLEGLKNLEYRGYDSAGFTVLLDGRFITHKDVGRVANLEPYIAETAGAHIGMAHTRWATHGAPSAVNAHPHFSNDGRFAVVHNGIIENYAVLREYLENHGVAFKSETDTEVIVQLIAHEFRNSALQAVRDAIARLDGTFGLLVMDVNDPYRLIAVRQGSPLVIGVGENEYIAASDVSALISHTRQVIYLEDGEIAELTLTGYRTSTFSDVTVIHSPTQIDWEMEQIEKGGFDHFMLKEIFEQPDALRNTFAGRIRAEDGSVKLGGIAGLDDEFIRNLKRVVISACGTAWHAGLIGEYVIEELARLNVEVEYASEFRYRNPVIGPSDLMMVISQSGETADTLAALREAKTRGARVMGVCNVVGSTIAREAGMGIYTHAGPEIGVASTKAFTTQIAAMIMLAIQWARLRGNLSQQEAADLARQLVAIPDRIAEVCEQSAYIKTIAEQYSENRNFLYLGRGESFPIALEGALKLKEISYIHAEGYPAAEMKHGPIALVDENMPVVVLASHDGVYEKIISNIQEIRARKGRVIAVASAGDTEIEKHCNHVIYVPQVHPLLSPLVTVVPLQLLAYHIAVLRGCDVDKPRNLAKSVTVE
ncbi:MAG: glutamine--fructose-6-phosphate transaminase (isomerizing) [bacterium]|nr:glutamine--fructose-6-phosphate transaminase (isomerizing) [bacterium]